MWKISMHTFRSKTKILGIFTPFWCSKTSIWFRPTSFMSKTRVWGGFIPFHCRTWPIVKISIGVHLMHEFMPPKPFLILSQPIHYFRSKTHVLGGSMPFRSRTWHVVKIGIEVHLMHEFMPVDPFLVFCSKHGQSTTLVPKLMFWIVSCHFVAPPDPLEKFVSGSI